MGKSDVKFVLNRKAFGEQILNSETLGEICASHLGADAEISHSNNSGKGGRVRARVYGSMSDEQANGALSKRLGGSG